jgi:hypothetical protein
MWKTLNEKQKIKYTEYCDEKYGKTIFFCETGEPMYIDEQGYRVDTDIVIKLLFSVSEN